MKLRLRGLQERLCGVCCGKTAHYVSSGLAKGVGRKGAGSVGCERHVGGDDELWGGGAERCLPTIKDAPMYHANSENHGSLGGEYSATQHVLIHS